MMGLNANAQTNLWSVTPNGGTEGAGAIYKISDDGLSYQNALNFPVTGFVGASPKYNTQCQATNGKIYGTMTEGGFNNLGLIYSYDITTSTFTALYHFNALGDGINPSGSLMQASNGLLYGMTPDGGAFSSGVIFSFDIVTGIYTKLFDFQSTNGKYPAGGLIQASNGLLYGTTFQGGLNNGGTIFSFNTSTLTFIKLHDMATGSFTVGNLKQSLNGKLYGMTSLGGANNQGTIFSYDISTSTYSKRFDFLSANGYYPLGGLVETTSGLFYGLTPLGGTNADGVIFSFVDATTTYTKLHEFNNSLATNGGSPYSSLMLASNGKLYGTTTINGTAGGGTPFGTIFSFTINTSTYAKVFSFTGTATGGSPQTALLQATNGKLYGLCNGYGNGPFGSAFSWDPTTSLFVKLTDLFVIQVGGRATGSMIKASDGLFYGLSQGGGNNLSGTLYSYNTSSNVLLKLVDLPANSNPEGALVQAPDGKLYGMTRGGGSGGFGSIFSYDISTATFTILHNMANATGRTPSGSLIVGNDGNLYGMTTYGGATGDGVIFKFVISTSTYIKLADLNSSINGERPYGNLLKASNGLMYGLNILGGANNFGVLFEFNPTTNVLTKKLDFGGTIGAQPWGSLIQATNGLLYGLTTIGGVLNGGTIFSYNTSTNTGTKIHDFSNILPSGNTPYGTLFQSANGKLYGATRIGGTNNLGTVFSYDINTATFTKIHDNATFDGINSLHAAFIETGMSLAVGTIPTYLCEGSTINIPVETSDLFNAGNVFTAQLSNSSGSFASPTTIGTLTSQTAGNISATIPTGLSNSGYRIRIVSSSPAITTANSPSLIIRPFNKTIFFEQMGIVAGTTTTSAHETANGFDNDGLTMTGSADVRVTVPSNGYSQASGNANVFFNITSGLNFQISGINTTGQTGLELSFGIYKSSTLSIADLLIVEVSSDGVSYQPLTYTLPIGPGTNVWQHRTATGVIPATANLRIRFRQSAVIPTNQYRIDDIRLSADNLNPSITAATPTFVCNFSTLSLFAPTNQSYLWSNGSTIQNIVVSTAGIYNCTMTSFNGCSATSNSINVNDSTPSQFSVTGGGTYCSSPGTGSLIGMSSSQVGYNYQLYLGITPVGAPVAGTGSSLSFGLKTATGNYSVISTYGTSTCTRNMLNTVNVGVATSSTYYADTDGDGFGNPAAPIQLCAPTVGYSLNNTDCNDTAAVAYPGATEICNGIDDDCDNYIDEGCGAPIYCIGPSASYIAPSGPSYVNQFSPFPTLNAAVTFLNSFAPTSHVIFELQNDYTSTGEAFPIIINYQGNASATAVFRPRSDVSTMLTISGVGVGVTSGLIEFTGADYVTFDGSPGGVQGNISYLRVRNTTNGNANANFHLKSDATHNTINAITIEGGNNSYHCILLGSSLGTTGNDFNIIRNNVISNRSDGSPFPPEIAVHSSGAGNGAAANSDNEIINNKIVNISDGIKIELFGNEGNWNISNNHIYFTNNSLTTKISEAISVSSIGNLTATISSNYIGGTAPFAAGAPMIETSGTIGTGSIYVRILNATTKSTISGNVIKNMQRPSVGGGSFTGIVVESCPTDIIDNVIGDPNVLNDLSFGDSCDILFKGINYTSAQDLMNISISGNKLSNLLFSRTGSTSRSFLGIYYSNPFQTSTTSIISNNLINSIDYRSQGNVTCITAESLENAALPLVFSANVIENIKMSNVDAGSFKGIFCEKANVSIIGNRIGSFTNPDDISIASVTTHYGISLNFNFEGNGLIQYDTIANFTLTNTSASNKFIGIYARIKGSLINEVSSNVVKNISSHAIGSGNIYSNSSDFNINGILYLSLGTSGLSVSKNSISGLKAVTTSSLSNTGISAISILRNSAPLLNVNGNSIHSLTNTCTSTSSFPMIFGIRFTGIQSNSTTLINNMISLNNGTNTNAVDIYGIYDDVAYSVQNGNSKNYYYNSVSISGSNSNTARSSAFWQSNNDVIISLKNNIFHNTRSGTGSHFAIVNESGSIGAWTSSSSDYNDLYTSNSNSLGAFPLNSTLTFAGWKSVSGGDSHSQNVAVNFVNNTNDLHLLASGNCTLEGSGIAISGQTLDFDGQSRNISTPDIGADEFTGICATLVNLKAFIQGFYISAGSMRKTIDPIAVSTNCDSVVLQLAQATPPYTILFTDTAILQTNGDAQFSFPSSVSGNNYYLVLKHRNALKIWSANSVTLANGFSYDFTTAANKAYGSNQVLLQTGIFGLYSGDVNQDGSINNSDYTSIENITQNIINGYYPQDLTGDHQIESSDFSLIENNAQLLLNIAHP